jgi:transcriptional regulator with XRE-family HTH domain
MNPLAEVSFGEWLKRRRSGMGLTRQQLAAQIHYSTVALKKVEAEERRSSPEIVERLAEIFNIPREERAAFLRFARGDWQSAPPSKSENAPWQAGSPSPRSNLPAIVTSLIGREEAVADVQAYLLRPDIRLVTLR